MSWKRCFQSPRPLLPAPVSSAQFNTENKKKSQLKQESFQFEPVTLCFTTVHTVLLTLATLCLPCFTLLSQQSAQQLLLWSSHRNKCICHWGCHQGHPLKRVGRKDPTLFGCCVNTNTNCSLSAQGLFIAPLSQPWVRNSILCFYLWLLCNIEGLTVPKSTFRAFLLT